MRTLFLSNRRFPILPSICTQQGQRIRWQSIHPRAIAWCHVHLPTPQRNACTRTRTLAACALAWISSCRSSTRRAQQTKFQSKTTPSPIIPLTNPEPCMAYGRPSMPAPKAMLVMLRMVSRELPSPPEDGGAGPVGATSLLLSMLLLLLLLSTIKRCWVPLSRVPLSRQQIGPVVNAKSWTRLHQISCNSWCSCH